jgi:hypothetical protein
MRNDTSSRRGLQQLLGAPLQRITVSRVFWDKVNEVFPILRDEPSYAALFWYLLFGSRHDKETHRLLLESKVLARMENRDEENTKSGRFLERFRTNVIPSDGFMSWTEWYQPKRKCRQLRSLSFGPFDAMIEKEHERHWHGQGRVCLDGSVFTVAKQRHIRRAETKEVALLPGLCPDATDIQQYMNNLAPNLFSQLVTANLADATAVALNLPSQNKKQERVRQEQRRLLRHIESQPLPLYTASQEGNTVRLFTRHSIPNLKGDVRRVLTPEWSEADLRCSQLAICARLWNVPEIQAFLATGTCFWEFLFNQMEVAHPLRKTAKNSIKKGVYSICFGMEECHLKGTTAYDLVKNSMPKELAGRFLEVPIIKILLNARERALHAVEQKGGELTPYGKWCPVTEERLAHNVMAEVAQAWEMKLIYPAFALARETDEFKIALYQFDGFSAHFKRRPFTGRPETWQSRIKEAVQREIDKHGINTVLEWKENGTEVLTRNENDTRENTREGKDKTQQDHGHPIISHLQ